MSNETERRKHHRIKARWPISVLLDQDIVKGETINITVDGVLISCEEPLRMNEILRMSINPPHHQAIEVTGKVMWSDHYAVDEQNTTFGMGICFVKISDVDRHFLKDVVSSHPQE